MPKLRYLRIRFANSLFPAEVPWFRSAVIEKTRRQSSLFHNHQSTNGYLYRYPLIQYKVTDRKATIICLEGGTDDIHYLLQERQMNLRVGRREEDFQIEDVQLYYHQVQTWPALFEYALKSWQALNQENFQQYSRLTTEVERLQFLEGVLRSHLMAFASGVGWQAEEQIVAHITRFKEEKWLPFKGQKVLTFGLNFRTNVSLPDYIGLGKGVSVGFGSVKGFGGARRVDRPGDAHLAETRTGHRQDIDPPAPGRININEQNQ